MPLRGQEKTVNVKMPKACHQVVQVLKAQYGIPMGDVMYYPARHEIMPKRFVYMMGVLETHGIPLIRMRERLLWMAAKTACMNNRKIGRYKGVWEIPEPNGECTVQLHCEEDCRASKSTSLIRPPDLHLFPPKASPVLAFYYEQLSQNLSTFMQKHKL